MKRFLFTLSLFVFSVAGGYAQWIQNGSQIYFNGKVGVGVTNPSAHLHIGQNRVLRIGEACMSSGGNHLHLSNNAWLSGSGWKNINSSRTGGLMQISDGAFNYYTTGSGSSPSVTHHFTIKSSGDVGIGGVWSPQARLHVFRNVGESFIRITNSHYHSLDPNSGWELGLDGGTFRIRDHQGNEIFNIEQDLDIVMGHSSKRTTVLGKLCVKPTVGTSCPDYVFEEDYDLINLKDLEAYLKEYKHLPGVKSAGEIEEAGSVDFIEMSYSLLEKVEELTLYTIEQQKEIEALKALVGEQSKGSEQQKTQP